jgi:hypothetical protein
MKKSAIGFAGLILVLLLACCGQQGQQAQQKIAYKGVTTEASYAYHQAGGKNWVHGFAIKVDNAKALSNPGLVFLASGIQSSGQALLKFNGKDYTVPAQDVDFSNRTKAAAKPEISGGKASFYADERGGADVISKIVIPLKAEDLKTGINDIEFLKSGDKGYEITGAQIQSVTPTAPTLVAQTYHLLARGRPATIDDFDKITALNEKDRWTGKDAPQWSIRGKVNFYRSGMDEDLDRMFQMFKEAHVNLVSVSVPRATTGDAYVRAKALIDRLHANNMKAVGFNSLGGVSIRTLLMNPAADAWIARDEYGDRIWRNRGGSYVSDVSSPSFRNEVLEHAGIQMDAGVDELYYDYGLGGTADVRTLFQEVRDLGKKKGKQIGVFGNCKGNILVDEIADVVKTEGTEEAGVWDGKWVNNIPQARLYYTVAYGKRYESKYEGADPGVPNPGGHDVRDGMKMGWKRPIAEATAFQSDFAIAESGPKLLNGWVHQDNPLAVQTWKDIVNYFTFKAENQDLITDISTVSKVGLVAPPLVPSFEVKLRREALYKALAEMNIMYDVLLLHHVTPELLSHYKALIISDIPWMDASQMAAIDGFKKSGGKIYTIRSSEKLCDLSDITSPADIFGQLGEPAGRKTVANNVRKVEGEPLITLEGTRYVAANLLKKNNEHRYILHLVNYDKPLKNVRVKLNLEGVADAIDAKSLHLFSPDAVRKEVKVTKASAKAVEFVVPALDVWDVIVFD